MDGLIAPPARYAQLQARHLTSPMAAVLVEVDKGRQELLVAVDPDLGTLTGTLVGDGFEAGGRDRVVLTSLSPYRTTAVTTIQLRGYDLATDQCRQCEAAIGLVWTVAENDPTSIEVAGTALVFDLEPGHFARFEAVRYHPFNRFQTWASIGQDIAALEPERNQGDFTPAGPKRQMATSGR